MSGSVWEGRSRRKRMITKICLVRKICFNKKEKKRKKNYLLGGLSDIKGLKSHISTSDLTLLGHSGVEKIGLFQSQ